MVQETHTVNIRMPKKLFKELVKEAKDEKRSLSKQIILNLENRKS